MVNVASSQGFLVCVRVRACVYAHTRETDRQRETGRETERRKAGRDRP